MIRHTLATLGPKVLASRQVRDYTTLLYGPAARAGRALDGPTWAGARDLARYKAKVRAAWPAVRVDHVESSGVADSPQVGDVLRVRAFVSLGDLAPDEVEVQVVHGRASVSDELRDIETAPLAFAQSYEGGRYSFEGDLVPTRTGAFGYTVRILPSHPAMANNAALGLVANA
jgi:starch phosphorylase